MRGRRRAAANRLIAGGNYTDYSIRRLIFVVMDGKTFSRSGDFQAAGAGQSFS
jgi:hypothetical protein